MRPRRTAALAAALVGACLALAPGAVVGPATATTHEQADEPPVRVEVTRVSPQVLRPGEDLAVSATIVNDGPTPVTEPRVRLGLDRRGFISRTSLDRWREADVEDPAGAVVAEVDLSVPLPPGGSLPVVVQVPSSALGLRTAEESWGPRGIALEVVDAADPARRRLGLERTFLLWFTPQEVTATRLSVLVPLVGPAVDPFDDAWVTDLEAATADDGRLGRVLAATADHPDVSWALDPWLVDVTHGPSAGAQAPPDAGDAGDAAGTGDAAGAGAPADPADPGDDAGATERAGDAADDGAAEADADATPGVAAVAGPGARDWAGRLLASTTDREVQLLPYLDPDVAALAHTGAQEALAAARERSLAVLGATDLPDGAPSSVVWPAGDEPDLATAALAATGGDRSLVVGPGVLPPPGVLTYTPTGRTTVATAQGEVTVLVPDERVSLALRTGAVTPAADGDVAPLRTDAPTPATAAQDVLAELAVVTRERPSDARHLLATLPRDWSPDPAVASAQLAALGAAPWVRTEQLPALVGAPDPGVDRGTLPTRRVDASEVDRTLLDRVEGTVATRERLATMVPEPERVMGVPELERLAPLSVAWRRDPAGRAALAAASEAVTAALRGGVTAQQGSDVLLIATSAGLRVRLVNTLPQPATVEVTLAPTDRRLRVDAAVPATVPAQGETLVTIPVHAIQSADVDASVVVRAPSGELVHDSTTLAVRVRADWEGIGTAVLGGLLALGVLVGLLRTIRRGRTGRRAEPQLEAGPDALSPETTPAVPDGTAGAATYDGPDDGPDAVPDDRPDDGRAGGTPGGATASDPPSGPAMPDGAPAGRGGA